MNWSRASGGRNSAGVVGDRARGVTEGSGEGRADQTGLTRNA